MALFWADGPLHYKTDERGNRIVDFSAAGYQGGGVWLPVPAVSQKLTAVKGAVAPGSRYLEQWRERLGERALRNIGY